MLRYSKNELRTQILSERALIPREEKRTLDLKICELLTNVPEINKAKNVLVYAPLKGEIDLTPFFDFLSQSNKRTAFPKCLPMREMDFRFCEYSSLKRQSYGILEPVEDSKKFCGESDSVCILPCLAADRDGFRLGYGGGYYDRFLSKHNIFSIAAVYSRFLFECDSFEKGEYDIPANIVLSEDGGIRL